MACTIAASCIMQQAAILCNTDMSYVINHRALTKYGSDRAFDQLILFAAAIRVCMQA